MFFVSFLSVHVLENAIRLLCKNPKEKAHEIKRKKDFILKTKNTTHICTCIGKRYKPQNPQNKQIESIFLKSSSRKNRSLAGALTWCRDLEPSNFSGSKKIRFTKPLCKAIFLKFSKPLCKAISHDLFETNQHVSLEF